MGMNHRRLGKYELQERLESGAVGSIWKAFNTQQRRYVTMKIIPVNAQTGADFAPRFYHEAQNLAALHHPNIVPIQDFYMSQSGNEACIIMDYVEGPSLADYLSATAHKGNIPPFAEIVGLLAPIAGALDYAHQRNVIHGALRAAAILLGKVDTTSPSPGEPKLTDFGLNHIQNPLALSLDNVSYISPEIAQGFAGTSRSDLYSLGVILYEMCTGALPFHGDTPGDILMQHIHATSTSPALINPNIPPALIAVIMRSLARDPAARYPTATALVTMVARALNMNMPESVSHSHPSPDTVNPPSLSGMDTMDSPTYLSQPPQQSLSISPPVPPVVAGREAAIQPAPPFPNISSSTPALPVTSTESAPVIQAPEERQAPKTPISLSPFAISASTPRLTTPPGPSVPQQTLGQTVPPTNAPPVQKRRPGWLYTALVAVLLFVLVGSALGAYLFYTRSTTPTQSIIVGHAFFLSSGVLSSRNSNQGITDELQINLQNLPDPQPGKRYYAWLLNDREIDLPAVAIGPLPLIHRQVTMTFSDPQHNNLLANYGHFLVTEEEANQPPTNPSLDINTWRYSAVFSTRPNPADTVNHFSLFDHLRHLLSQDPKLKLVGLGGGLDIWLFRNTSKILEAAGSARDAQKGCTSAPNNSTCAFVHRSLVRILDYLDGGSYVQTDVPLDTPLYIDPTIARVALLEFDVVHQQPPGYLRHIGTHLREMTGSPGVSPEQRTLAIRITQAINNVQDWLKAVHTDAVKLEKMDNSQLSQPDALSILNDLFTQANRAFVGQFDPNTSTVIEGVVQIHNNIQRLATFDVTPCTINNGKNTCS
ncbi:MAG TPA: protein kinase [Ktedonobacteraceae bacterium]|nr:protein kinase [Ktedonobacteraceae bacterium]